MSERDRKLATLIAAGATAQALINQVIAALRTPEEINREELWGLLQDARNTLQDAQIMSDESKGQK